MKRLHAFFAVLSAITLLEWLVCPSTARAARETRLSVVVGNNGSGTLGRAELRYADDDAAKYAELLGGVAQEGDVELLVHMDADTARLFPAEARVAKPATRASLEAAIGRIAERARIAKERGDRVVFTFVFAGHGDVEAGRGFLELEDGRFFREDLEAMLARVPAARAHVLLDACNSVYMLASRKPGGTRFATPEDIERSMSARLAHVGTFLSTSADAQVYEWSQIESGVFSHAVRSGLAGAADLDGDGRITYGELRAFVRVASAGVPNPRFRPRIYARGPSGRDDEVLFEPRAAGDGQKLPLAAGAERRITVLDANEVPRVDVRLERGFAANVFLPLAPTEGKSSFVLVEHEEGKAERRTSVAAAASGEGLVALAEPIPPGPAARSSRSFELLFALPFGPRAVAALPPEPADAAVYGVSPEDRERMARLLDAAAGMQRDRRLGVGIGLGGGGVIFAGTGLALLSEKPEDTRAQGAVRTTGAVFLGLGVAGLGVGAYQLLSTSRLEDRREAFVAALHEGPERFDLAVLEAETELFTREQAARSTRMVAGYAATTLGVLALGSGIIGELAATTDEQRLVSRVAMAAGVGYGVLGIGTLFIRSEEERLAQLWRQERAIPDPREDSSFRIKPVVGLGTLGLAGTF